MSIIYLPEANAFFQLIFVSGYMAPEYAIDGLFSVKSDAYSFGVLLLEIVSGKKIRQFYDSDSNVNLLGHVRAKNFVLHY